jgi:RNA polymerase sigma-70 factor (ECF subfamily)
VNIEDLDAQIITNQEENDISHRELIRLIQQLSPGYRSVFNLYVIEGYRHEEISEILGISVGTSKSNLAKARLKLREMLMKIDSNEYARITR